jgi:leucyl aminopeptidase
MNLQESIKTSVNCFLDTIKLNQTPATSGAQVFVVGGKDLAFLLKKLESSVPTWQLEASKDSKAAQISLAGANGPIWILRPDFHDSDNRIDQHSGKLNHSSAGLARDVVGQWLRMHRDPGADNVALEFHKLNDEQIGGALLGLGLAAYKFLDVARKKDSISAKFFVKRDKGTIKKEILQRSLALARGMNIARHLTNLPAGHINPATMAKAAQFIFSKRKGVRVVVWDEARLKKEGMGLLLGVGQGSETGSRLIHISYRPKSVKKGVKPIAFVGKGVTFDTGGLDIKPASGMRWMKKDMAGSATVLGLASYVSELGLPMPCDFYLAMAENAISATSTRPGDVHIARNGKAVEIHNTDAEGRLAMADALDVAVTREGKDEPTEVFDVSTLTGAMRVAVGLDVAGFFSNNDKMAGAVEKAAALAGEFAWRMPLVQKYKKQHASSYADFANASDSGFAGAITAALFLENFVGGKNWTHFDVMSWNMSADGAMSDGANAQTLQILAAYLDGK